MMTQQQEPLKYDAQKGTLVSPSIGVAYSIMAPPPLSSSAAIDKEKKLVGIPNLIPMEAKIIKEGE